MEKISKVYICIYNWVTVLPCRDWHNTVNQLHFNQKIKHQTFWSILFWDSTYHKAYLMKENQKSLLQWIDQQILQFHYCLRNRDYRDEGTVIQQQ